MASSSDKTWKRRRKRRSLHDSYDKYPGLKLLHKLRRFDVIAANNRRDDSSNSKHGPSFAKRGMISVGLKPSFIGTNLLADLVDYGPQCLIERQLHEQPQDKQLTQSPKSLRFDVTTKDHDDGNDDDNEDDDFNSKRSWKSTCGTCVLADGPMYTINNQEISNFFKSIFDSTIDSMSFYGYSTNLTRYDLFHGHLFITPPHGSVAQDNFHTSNYVTERYNETMIGMLLHCYEYPITTKLEIENDNAKGNVTDSTDTDDADQACSDDDDCVFQSNSSPCSIENSTDSTSASSRISRTVLPGVNLGYCQLNSNCQPTLDEWRYRNVLWYWYCCSNGYGLANATGDTVSKHIGHSNDTIHQQQSIWLLDGNTTEIAKLRIDYYDGYDSDDDDACNTTTSNIFGYNCPNTVWEGYFGQVLCDVYNVDNELFCTNIVSAASVSSVL